ncbi:HK97 family phage prohead protease [Streptomyces sp. NBRC 109706]|uniref:HK97 family phage prohead protease n=1 Tax=Streptomyces sp. NBRC 109706 TaxID=1550035 RepID=UPI000783DBCA|nr:HK97 family phage prohead protease [Streptomyces sp. NBRC 109706]
MLIKDAPARVKVTDVDAESGGGEFTALVSVFGNIDSYGDVVQPGAFERTLKEWSASGYPIPVYWGHNLADPDYNIGSIVEAVETDRGLQVRAQLDMDSPKAPQVYRLLKGGRVKEFSFGYQVRDAGWGEKDGAEVYELRDIDLYEVSVVPVGANPATELQTVKALGERTGRAVARALEGIKAGRVLSGKNENALREARDQLVAAAEGIDGVLSALDTPEPPVADEAGDEKKSQEQTPATEQEPDPAAGTKSDEPGAPTPDFAAASLEARVNIKKRSAQ